MDTSVKALIRKRKSVRTFGGKPLLAEDRQRLEAFLRSMNDPGIETASSIGYILTYEVKN